MMRGDGTSVVPWLHGRTGCETSHKRVDEIGGHLPSLRIVKVSLSFRTRPASSLVAVIRVLPMIGKRTSTTGPAARRLASGSNIVHQRDDS